MTTLYYNEKSDFDAPEVYDVALRLEVSVPMVRQHVSTQPVRGCVIWIHLQSNDRILYVKYV